MFDVGRRAHLLLALPAPAIETSIVVVPPLLMVGIDEATQVYNSRVARWWRDRTLLGTAVRDVQTSTLAVRADVERQAGQLYARLASVLQAALAVDRHWQTIFADLYRRGSSARSRHEFIVRWCVLGPTQQALVYEYGAAPMTLHEVEHRSASLVAESACMAYLRCALLQQMATLAYVATRQPTVEPGLSLPALDDVCTFLRRALSTLRELCDNVLPLHFAVRNGTEPYLIAVHFYRGYLARLVAAQHSWLHAVREHEHGVPIGSAALFANAERLLAAALRTPYADVSLLGGLAAHRRAMALITLAQALSAAERNTVIESPLAYGDGRPGEPDEVPDYQALAVEAYYCARAALALTPSIDVVREQYKRIAQRLETVYSAVLPADIVAYQLAAPLVFDLRLRLATADPAWRREYNQVTIEPHIGPSGPTRLIAAHKRPTSSVVSVGAERRRFYIHCAYELK